VGPDKNWYTELQSFIAGYVVAATITLQGFKLRSCTRTGFSWMGVTNSNHIKESVCISPIICVASGNVFNALTLCNTSITDTKPTVDHHIPNYDGDYNALIRTR